MKKTNWRLFHSVRRQEIVDLNATDAVKILSEVSANDIEFWFAWRPGFQDWVKATECSELREEVSTKLVVPPPPPPPAAKEAPAAIAAPTPENQGPAEQAPAVQAPAAEKPSDRRVHQRIDTRMAVVIVSTNRTFRSHTRDISLGGLKLEKPLPWKLPVDDCSVFITSPHTNDHIEFRARVIASTQNPDRIAFEGADEEFKTKLFNWISLVQAKQLKAA